MADDDWAVLDEAGATTAYEASPARLAMDSGISAVVPGRRIVARSFTVMCDAGDNLPIHAALEAAPPGDVLVVSTRSAGFGYWGEVTTVAAQARGLAGLVIDGGVRDVAAIRRLGFPVWSRAISIHGTVKAGQGTLRAPISCGGVVVHNGDVIVADDDGVAVIPEEDVRKTVESARARMAKEGAYLERLNEGHLTLDLLGLRRRPTP